MLRKKNFAVFAAALLIILFFSLYFYRQSEINQKINTNEILLSKSWTEDITVTNGIADPPVVSESYEISEEGFYSFGMDISVAEPGFITGCVVLDPEGNDVYAYTAFSCTGMDSQRRQLDAGEYTFEYHFLTTPEDYILFTDEHAIYSNAALRDQAITRIGFENFSKNGTRNVSLAVSVKNFPFCNTINESAVTLPLLVILVLSFTLLIASALQNNETSESLKERLHELGIRYSAFGLTVFLVSMIFNFIILRCDSDFVSTHITSLNLLLIILSVDIAGFSLLFWLTRKIPAENPAHKKLGIGRFLACIAITYTLLGIGIVLGTPLHNFICRLTSIDSTPAVGTLIQDSGLPLRILTVCILAPIFEELIFRKLLIDRLNKHGEFVCVLLSGLMFGLYHGNFSQFFYTALMGMFWALVYLRTGKLRYSIGLHMILNTSTSVITTPLALKCMDVVYENPYAPVVILYSAWLIFLIVLMIAGFILMLVNRKKAHLRTVPGEESRFKTFLSAFGTPSILLFVLYCVCTFVLSYFPAG